MGRWSKRGGEMVPAVAGWGMVVRMTSMRVAVFM